MTNDLAALSDAANHNTPEGHKAYEMFLPQRGTSTAQAVSCRSTARGCGRGLLTP